MDRVKKNLAFWKGLVGLKGPFPDLPPIPDRELSSLMVMDPAQIEYIRASLGSHQLIQIEVEPGWGCTTLFKYIFHDALDQAMERLILPVRIDLELLFRNQDVTSASLVDAIKRQLIGLLMDRPWEQTLNRDYYFTAIHYDESTDLATYKARMAKFLFAEREPTGKQLMAHFPWLQGELHDLLGYLLANFRIQTVLFFHFPRDLDLQIIRDLVRSLKTNHERGAVAFAALREVYFCTPTQRSEVGRDFVRPFHVLRYPRYTYAQIFTMLVKRYTPYVSSSQGRNQVSLESVFDESFVERAWRTAGSLTGIIQEVKKTMERRLDCPEALVSFKLTPDPPRTEPPQSPQSDPVNGVRQRFQRRAPISGPELLPARGTTSMPEVPTLDPVTCGSAVIASDPDGSKDTPSVKRRFQRKEMTGS